MHSCLRSAYGCARLPAAWPRQHARAAAGPRARLPGERTLMSPARDEEARRGARRQQPTSGRSLRDAVALRRSSGGGVLATTGVDGSWSADRPSTPSALSSRRMATVRTRSPCRLPRVFQFECHGVHVRQARQLGGGAMAECPGPVYCETIACRGGRRSPTASPAGGGRSWASGSLDRRRISS